MWSHSDSVSFHLMKIWFHPILISCYQFSLLFLHKQLDSGPMPNPIPTKVSFRPGPGSTPKPGWDGNGTGYRGQPIYRIYYCIIQH